MVNSTHRLRQYHPLVEVIITVYCYTLSHLYHTQKRKLKEELYVLFLIAVCDYLVSGLLRIHGAKYHNYQILLINVHDSVLLKLNKYLPIKEVELNDNDKEWMSPQLKTMFSKREKAFQCKEKPLWRRLRNKINRMIMYNKNRYYNARVSQAQVHGTNRLR